MSDEEQKPKEVEIELKFQDELSAQRREEGITTLLELVNLDPALRRERAEVIVDALMLLGSRVDSLEEKLSDGEADTGTFGQRLHKYKTEMSARLSNFKTDITDMLKRHGEERAEMAARTDEIIDGANGALVTLQNGLNRAEGKFYLLWNTFNGFVRFMEWMVTDSEQLKRVVPDGSNLNRESFTRALLAAGKEVFDESRAHEKKEFERMKAEKARHGKVLSPVQPRERDASDHLSAFTGQLMNEAANDPELIELAKLKAEVAQDTVNALSTNPRQKH